jgi:hypothetical protein
VIQHANHIVAWAALMCAALVSWLLGRRPERIGFLLIMANWVATPLVEDRRSWLEVQYAIMGANAALTLALSALAIRTRRAWPLAAAGLEFTGVMVRLAPTLNAHALTRAAPFADAVIGYVVLGSVVGGAIVEGHQPSLERASPSASPIIPVKTG